MISQNFAFTFLIVLIAFFDSVVSVGRKTYPSIKIGEYYYRYFNWKEWYSWSKCTRTCGSGIRKRYRLCLAHNVAVVDKKYCDEGKEFSIEVCHVEASCPESYDCYNSESGNAYYFYGILGTRKYAGQFCCSKNMLVPRKKQINGTLRNHMTHGDRYWIAEYSKFGLNRCGYVTQTKNFSNANCTKLAYVICEKKNSQCPIENFYWAVWSAWGDCSKSCDTGFRKRFRVCISRRTKQEIFSRFCEGPSSMSAACNEKACPIRYECLTNNETTLYFYEHSILNPYAKSFCSKRNMSLPKSSDFTTEFKKRMPHDRYWIQSLDPKAPDWCFYIDRKLIYVDVQCVDPGYVVCKDDKHGKCNRGKYLCHHCYNSPRCEHLRNSVALSSSLEYINKTTSKVGHHCAVCMFKKMPGLRGSVFARGCFDNDSKCGTDEIINVEVTDDNILRWDVAVNVVCCSHDLCN